MFGGGSCSLKYYKRLKIYKNSTNTVSFDPEYKLGYSYNWNFLAMVNGKLVFNNYRWSTTTTSHQYAVASTLRDLKLPYISGDFGSTSVNSLSKQNSLNLYKQIVEKEIEIELTKRKDTRTYNWRVSQLADLNKDLSTLESLGWKFKLSQKVKKEIRKKTYDDTFDNLNDRQSEKAYKKLILTKVFSDVSEIAL